MRLGVRSRLCARSGEGRGVRGGATKGEEARERRGGGQAATRGRRSCVASASLPACLPASSACPSTNMARVRAFKLVAVHWGREHRLASRPLAPQTSRAAAALAPTHSIPPHPAPCHPAPPHPECAHINTTHAGLRTAAPACTPAHMHVRICPHALALPRNMRCPAPGCGVMWWWWLLQGASLRPSS